MASSQSNQDDALPTAQTETRVTAADVAEVRAVFQTASHADGILFRNVESGLQYALEQAATNEGIFQLLNTTATPAAGTTTFYLVSVNTQQAVELASSIESGMRASQQPKALALFCHAHASDVLEKMNEKDLASHHPDGGGFMKWTDDDAEHRYKALTGIEPPRYV